MNKRENMLCALNHEECAVPSWTMAFYNIATATRLLGEENVVTDFLPSDCYKTGGCDENNRLRNLRYSEKLDNFSIGVGKGANFAFGHGGPGEFMEKILSSNNLEYISQYETGVLKMVKRFPHFYHNYNFPLKTLEEAESLILPDGSNKERYVGIADDVSFYKSRGYFTHANLNGIFSGIHYYLYPYDKLFIDMILEKEQLKLLIKKLAVFNLAAAEELLKTGVDCITCCDDLGDGRNMLFSPQLYDELFFENHKELAGLCHSYGAYLHLHSHGNILKIFDRLIDAGFDMINPCDPYEIGTMRSLKEAYGKRVTLVGGINKFFFDWDNEKMESYLKQTVSDGRKGGGYILMDSGGIPENITQEKFDFYIDISKRIRG